MQIKHYFDYNKQMQKTSKSELCEVWTETLIETSKPQKTRRCMKENMVWERRGDEACLWSRRLIVQCQDRASPWAHTGKRERIFGVYRRGDGETLSQRRGETFAIKLEKRRTATSVQSDMQTDGYKQTKNLFGGIYATFSVMCDYHIVRDTSCSQPCGGRLEHSQTFLLPRELVLIQLLVQPSYYYMNA